MKKKLRKKERLRKKAIKNIFGKINNRHKDYKEDCNSKEQSKEWLT